MTLVDPDNLINIRDGRTIPVAVARMHVSGLFGPVVDRFRFFTTVLFGADSANYSGLGDISEYVTGFSFAFDAATCKRSGTITIDFGLLPRDSRNGWANGGAGFDLSDMPRMATRLGVFACHEINIEGHWYRWPIGWFMGSSMAIQQGGQPVTDDTPASRSIVGLDGATQSYVASWPLRDITDYFETHTLNAPYTVPAGTSYVTALHDAIIESGFADDPGLTSDVQLSIMAKAFGVGQTEHLTPVAFTWPAGTAWSQVNAKLCEGMGAFPIWATNAGVITTGPKIRPMLLPVSGYFGTSLSPYDWQGVNSASVPNSQDVGAVEASNVIGGPAWGFKSIELWNQAVAMTNNGAVTPAFVVSQIPDSGFVDSLISFDTVKAWITKTVQIDCAANSDVLELLADWEVWYADFNSISYSISQPVEFFSDRIFHPYLNVVGYVGRNPFNYAIELWANMGYTFTYGQPMKCTYGRGLIDGDDTLDHPAEPE